MKTFIRNVSINFYKTKRTFLPWIHLFLPLGLLLVSILYIRGRSLGYVTILTGYLAFIGGVFPIIIGVITGKVAELEEEAGNFQMMLAGNVSRKISYLSILVSLLLGAFFSVSLAVIPFLYYLKGIPFTFYLYSICLFMGSVPFLYFFHLWISFQFGMGPSIGVGIFESLFGFLGLTGLGDGIWYFLPALWPPRLQDTFIHMWNTPGISQFYFEIRTWLFVALPYTILGLILSFLWISRWNGRDH
ncbi:MAG: lantibiotic immunity ABC transporter MutG family permease subunit [Tissierellia bacterium]|nr:lantibiotic immunity ABC transporter MutG family permease subunit [Tissierellia bacterium]